MSNLGLERYLKIIGLSMARTPVGDRYVTEHMRKHGFNVGGEQSGHIVLSDFTTTGDGLVSALQVLACVVSTGKPVSEVCKRFDPLPQLLKNVRYESGKPLEDKRVVKAIEGAKIKLGDGGRLVIRPSGTEPVIRVMAEGDDERRGVDRRRRHRRGREICRGLDLIASSGSALGDGIHPALSPGWTGPSIAKNRNCRVPPCMDALEGGHDVWVFRSNGINLEKQSASRRHLRIVRFRSTAKRFES